MGVGCGLERATTEEGAMASEREWVARYVPDVRYQQNVYARALAEELRPGASWLELGAGSKVHRGWVGVPEAEVVEGRRSADILPTRYRCNTPGRVRRLAAAAGLAAEEVLTFNSFPFFRRPPLILVEGAWIRVTDRLGPVGMRSNLLARLRRPVEAAA